MSPTIQPAPIRRSIHVNVEPARAFQVFTDGIGRWWPATHHIGASPYADARIEPYEGGRWYHVCQDGSESDVGRVLAWDPPERLLLTWQITGKWAFDPDFITEVEVTFRPENGGTRVDLEHRYLERYGDQLEGALKGLDSPNGWRGVLAKFAAAADA